MPNGHRDGPFGWLTEIAPPCDGVCQTSASKQRGRTGRSRYADCRRQWRRWQQNSR